MLDPSRFYTPPELIALSHAPRAFVYEALEAGELRAIRRGRTWLVPGTAAAAWMAELGRDPQTGGRPGPPARTSQRPTDWTGDLDESYDENASL